jgi:hypothetical protein
MSALKAIASFAPRVVSYVQGAAAGTMPDAYVFINPTGSGEYYEIVDVLANHVVAGGSGAAADVKIVASGTALSSGVTALATASSIDLTATAAIPQNPALATAFNSRLVKPGDSVGVDTSGTLTNLTGVLVQITLRPIRGKKF